jgi:SAM-dependent methyltransferase
VSSAEHIPGALDSNYGDRYGDLYRRHWWWRAREEAVMAEVTRLLGAPPSALSQDVSPKPAVLDIGSGDGLIFPRLEGIADVEGIEPDPRLVSARWGGRVHVTPFESFRTERRYALILMLDVLEHLAEPVEALRQVRELLLPGGRLLLTVPAFNLLWTKHDEINHHFTRYRLETLRRVVQEAGLSVERSRYLFHWVFAAKLLVRAREAVLSSADPTPSVPASPINRGLYAFSRLEQRIAGPLALPFGSSLMATCGVLGA